MRLIYKFENIKGNPFNTAILFTIFLFLVSICIIEIL